METYNPTERPADSTNEPLLALLEQSLEVSYMASGCFSTMGWLDWTVRPFTVLSQPCVLQKFEVDGHEPMTIPPGGGSIMPEGTRFRCLGPGLQGQQPLHWAHYRFRVLGELNLFHLIQSPYVISAQVSGRMTALNQKLARVREDSTTPLLVRVGERRFLCAEMLRLIFSVCAPRPDAMQSATSLARIMPALRFMREQMDRPIFLAEMAQLVGLSPNRFEVLFRQATRQSPLQYLTRLRMRQAQELLLSTRKPVNEVGESVGFRDAFHFSRTFKRFSGAGPREYRRLMEAKLTSGKG